MAASAASMARRSPLRLARSHHRLAHAGHDGADIGEVEIDQAFLHHQVGDAGDAAAQHVVGHGEGIGEGGLLVGDPEQVLVRDDEQRIDVFLQLVDAALGRAQAPRTFELERLGDDADGQDAFLARGARDDGGSPGSGAAAHAGGDERHVAADEMGLDVGHGLFRGSGANFRLRSGTETFGDIRAHLNAAFGARARQSLRVGIGDHELNALQTAFDHVVDGVAACAADTEYGDARLEFSQVRNSEVDGHGRLPILHCPFASALLSALPRDAPFRAFSDQKLSRIQSPTLAK